MPHLFGRLSQLKPNINFPGGHFLMFLSVTPPQTYCIIDRWKIHTRQSVSWSLRFSTTLTSRRALCVSSSRSGERTSSTPAKPNKHPSVLQHPAAQHAHFHPGHVGEQLQDTLNVQTHASRRCDARVGLAGVQPRSHSADALMRLKPGSELPGVC